MEQYNVTGMSCAACSARVEKAVSKDGFVPENFNAYVVDNVVAVNTTDAQRAAQKVLHTDAIPASVASGAVLQAAAQLIHVGASRSALAILPGRQLINTL